MCFLARDRSMLNNNVCLGNPCIARMCTKECEGGKLTFRRGSLVNLNKYDI